MLWNGRLCLRGEGLLQHWCMLCRKLGARDLRSIKPIDLMWYDITGYEDGIEYQILDTTNATHIKVSSYPLCEIGTSL